MPILEALSTATPENRVEQSHVQEVAEGFLAEAAPELLDLLPVFERTGIEARSFARELPWYLTSPGWGERADAFEATGTELAVQVTEELLDQADLPATSLDGVVFVTTTGLATPSLETHLANALDLRADAVRVPVWGLGCAGGVAGLARTADLARADPTGRYLLVSLELCSLAFLREDVSKKNVVAAALFGDGCAGALVAGDELGASGPRLSASRSHLWPDTEDVMGWDVLDEGLGVVFSSRIPEIVETRLTDVVTPFAKEQGLALDEARTVFHPGGPKVLTAYEDALGLPSEALDASREVLRQHGNMSSPTVLFALEESLDEAPPAPGDEALLAAVGPGFAAELAHLEGPA